MCYFHLLIFILCVVAVKPTLFGATSPKFSMAEPSPFALMLASRIGSTSQKQGMSLTSMI